jgi:nitrous oxidase accessory protein NosD
MAWFANGGDRVSHCQFIQDDPNLFGERSSHAFYIHSGSKDVEVADTEISGARKYSLQLYGENDPNAIQDVRLLRLNIHDVANGIILAHGAATAGIVQNCLIEGCSIKGVYAGSSVAIKNGQGVIVRNNVIDGNSGSANGHTGAGIYLGVWSPAYEVGFSLSDISVTGNTVRNVDRGIWSLPSGGGSFANCSILGNLVSGNRMNYDITGPGITWLPGKAPGAGKVRDSSVDTRPSDDRSLAGKQP